MCFGASRSPARTNMAKRTPRPENDDTNAVDNAARPQRQGAPARPETAENRSRGRTATAEENAPTEEAAPEASETLAGGSVRGGAGRSDSQRTDDAVRDVPESENAGEGNESAPTVEEIRSRAYSFYLE